MTKTKLAGRVIAVPIELLTTPREGDTVVNRWWAVRDGKVLFWQGPGNRHGWTPQCNWDQRVAEAVVGKLYPKATIEHVPVAFLGHWDENWGHVLTKDLLEAAETIDLEDL